MPLSDFTPPPPNHLMEELLNFLQSLNSQKKEELTKLKYKSFRFRSNYNLMVGWSKITENNENFEKEITSLTELTTQLDKLISFWGKEKNGLVSVVSETYRELNKKKSQEFDEEFYNLTKVLKEKDFTISELKEQLKIKSELASDFFHKIQENQDTFDLEKEKLLGQVANYHQEIGAAKVIFEGQRNLITELEEKCQELESEYESYKERSFKNTTALINKQKLESKEAKELIEELERCLETQIQAKETAESKLSQLKSPATPNHVQKSPLVRLRRFSLDFDEKIKLLEQKNQETFIINNNNNIIHVLFTFLYKINSYIINAYGQNDGKNILRTITFNFITINKIHNKKMIWK